MPVKGGHGEHAAIRSTVLPWLMISDGCCWTGTG